MYALTIALLVLAGIAALYIAPRMVRMTPPDHTLTPAPAKVEFLGYVMPADVKRMLHTLEADMVGTEIDVRL